MNIMSSLSTPQLIFSVLLSVFCGNFFFFFHASVVWVNVVNTTDPSVITLWGWGEVLPAVGGKWLSRIVDWHNRGGEERVRRNTLKPEQMSAEEKRIRSVNSPSRRLKQRRLPREADAFFNVLWWWGEKRTRFFKAAWHLNGEISLGS